MGGAAAAAYMHMNADAYVELMVGMMTGVFYYAVHGPASGVHRQGSQPAYSQESEDKPYSLCIAQTSIYQLVEAARLQLGGPQLPHSIPREVERERCGCGSDGAEALRSTTNAV